jgi:hypothetical protein
MKKGRRGSNANNCARGGEVCLGARSDGCWKAPRGRRSSSLPDQLNEAEAGTRRTDFPAANMDDDATVVTSNQGAMKRDDVVKDPKTKATKREDLSLPNDSVTTQNGRRPALWQP